MSKGKWGQSSATWNHAVRNWYAERYGKRVIGWQPGEMERLIEEALNSGKVRKLEPADVSGKGFEGFEETNGIWQTALAEPDDDLKARSSNSSKYRRGSTEWENRSLMQPREAKRQGDGPSFQGQTFPISPMAARCVPVRRAPKPERKAEQPIPVQPIDAEAHEAEILELYETQSTDFHVVKNVPRLKMVDLLNYVIRTTKISRDDIYSPRRNAEVAHARQLVMYLCHHFTTRSLPEIGKFLGGKDHTTVLHGVRKINATDYERPTESHIRFVLGLPQRIEE
jgi:hypothetical protein